MSTEVEDGSVCPFRLGLGPASLTLSRCYGPKCKLWREGDCALAGGRGQAEAKPQPPARGPGGKFLKREQ